MKQIIVVLLFSILAIENIHGKVTDDWFGEKLLEPNYLFKWRTDDTNKEIVVRVEVMTKGWVSFGFSKHGKTTEADVVIGWVDDIGRSTFNDFWVNEFGSRSVDTSQDWRLISATENATHTSLEFKRNYITCDELNDLEIFDNEYEPSNIVFGYSFVDPSSVEAIENSVSEGVVYLNLFAIEDKPKEKDIQAFDFTLNITLPKPTSHKPASQTGPPVILCKLFKNNFKEKHTIVKMQPVTLPAGLEIDHHIYAWSCKNKLDKNVAEKYLGAIFPCYQTSGPLFFVRPICSLSLISTAVLTDQVLSLPSDLGILFDPVEMPYFLMEYHIFNPTNKDLDISVALRLWMTKETRMNKVDVRGMGLAMGFAHSNWGFIVPPKQTSFIVSGITDSYCFETPEFVKYGGIYMFAILFHTHSALSHEVRHYRDDKLIRVLRYNHYVSDEQTYRTLKEYINFRKGDKWVNICEFNTINNTESITGSTQHCLSIFYYYPKIFIREDKDGGASVYWSRIPYKTMLKITDLEQIRNYENGSMEDILISKPDKYANTKLIDFVAQNKYKIRDPKVLEEFLISSDIEECCHFAIPKNGLLDNPCKTVSKPPGLYHSIVNRRAENSCPSSKQLIQKSGQRSESEFTHKAIENLKKIRLSFRLLMNSLKLSFDLND